MLKSNLKGMLFWGLVLFTSLSAMYIVNRSDIALEAEYQALEAVKEYIVEEKGLESWEVNAVLIDNSMKDVETDYRREFYNLTMNTKEVTYQFRFDDEIYTVTALVERIDNVGWRFYKITSIK